MHGYSATISGGGQPATLYPIRLDDIRGDNSEMPFAFQRFSIPGGVYRASSASPRHDICNFAVAASNGTSLLKEAQGEWTIVEKTPDQEVVALDWLSPTVIIKAGRFGAVKLWDIKYHAENSEPRIQHPTKITHVRRIDENIIAVAGTQDTVRTVTSIQCTVKLTLQLCTYDLRYAKPGRGNQYFDWFSTYRNNLSSHHSSGLDVHQNLMAAATDDGRVQIFDVRKGVELSSGISNDFENYTCVRFIDERTSGEALKLMVAMGPRIECWSFGGSIVKSLTTSPIVPTKY